MGCTESRKVYQCVVSDFAIYTFKHFDFKYLYYIGMVSHKNLLYT